MSDSVNFQDFISKERERLAAAMEDCLQRRSLVDEELVAIENSFAAIAAYEAAKTDKAQPTRTGRVRRYRRGGWREDVMTSLNRSPDGMTRGELLADLGLKGDRSSETSVSNALNALQKTGQVVRHNGGRWAVAAPALQQAAQ